MVNVVRISDSERYSAIARIMGNPEVDPGVPEVGFKEFAIDLLGPRFSIASIEVAISSKVLTSIVSMSV